MSPLELHILRLMLDDRESEAGLATQSEYAAKFPGYEDIVRRCHDEVADPERTAAAEVESPAATHLEIDRFRLLRKLGSGGQGAVWLAEDPRLHRQIALKVLTTKLLHVDPALRERMRKRLENEAAMAARLQDPGICAVYEFGGESEAPWIAMQHIAGDSLETVLGRDADRSHSDHVTAMCARIQAAARTIHIAHQAGLIHRDLKPGNLMCTPDDRVVVLDFGLALDINDESLHLTKTGETMGSPAYMSPEQIAGDRLAVDHRTDVYSLGLTLYECLSGRRPYDAATREVLFREIREGNPPRLRRLAPHVSRDLACVIACAMDRVPARRYDSALAFAEDLRRVAERRTITARRVGLAVRLARAVQRNPMLSTIGGAAFVVVTIVAAIYFNLTQELTNANTNLADANADLANVNKSLASANSNLATRNTELETKTKEAEWYGYVATIRAVSAHINALEIPDARLRLATCAEDLRGFEWHHLHTRLNGGWTMRLATNRAIATLDARWMLYEINSNTLGVLDVAADRDRCRLQHPVKFGQAYAISETAKVVATFGADRILRVWNAETGTLQRELRDLAKLPRPAGMSALQQRIQLSADGTRAAVWALTKPDQVHIFDLEKGRRVCGLPGKSSGVAFLGPDRVLSIGSADGAKVWQIPGATLERRIGKSWYLAMALSASRDRVALSRFERDGRSSTDIEIFATNTGKSLGKALGHAQFADALTFSPDGKILASSSRDQTVRLFDGHSGAPLRKILAPDDNARGGPFFSPDGKSLHLFKLNHMHRYPVNIGIARRRPVQRVHDFALSANGGLLYLARGNRPGRSNAETNELRRVVSEPGTIYRLAYDPNTGRLAAASYGGAVSIYETRRGLKRVHFTEPPGQVPGHSRFQSRSAAGSMVFDSRAANLYLRRSTQEWSAIDLDSGKLQPGTAPRIDTFAVDANGTRRFTPEVGHATFRPQDLPPELNAAGNPIAPRRPGALTVSPQRHLVAYAIFGGEVRIYRAQDGKRHTTITGNDSIVTTLAFDADAKRLAVGGRDSTVRIWDVETGALLLTVRGFPQQIGRVQFDPRSRRLFVQSNGLHVLEANTPTQDALAARIRVQQIETEVAPALDLLFMMHRIPNAVDEHIAASPIPKTLHETARLRAKMRGANLGDLFSTTWTMVGLPRAPQKTFETVAQFTATAIQMEPSIARFRDAHGMALYRAGKWPAALESFAVARTLAPQPRFAPGAVHAFVAMCEAKLGRTEAARQSLELAVKSAGPKPNKVIASILEEARKSIE